MLFKCYLLLPDETYLFISFVWFCSIFELVSWSLLAFRFLNSWLFSCICFMYFRTLSHLASISWQVGYFLLWRTSLDFLSASILTLTPTDSFNSFICLTFSWLSNTVFLLYYVYTFFCLRCFSFDYISSWCAAYFLIFLVFYSFARQEGDGNPLVIAFLFKLPFLNNPPSFRLLLSCFEPVL